MPTAPCKISSSYVQLQQFMSYRGNREQEVKQRNLCKIPLHAVWRK